MKNFKKLTLIIFFISLNVQIWPVEPMESENEQELTGDAGEKKEKINKPEQDYLEMAVNYINDRNFVQAKKYLQMAEGSGDEKIFQETQVWKMYVSALEGEKNLDNTLNVLSGELYAKGLYYISDGWQNYFDKNPSSKDLYELSLAYKEKLIVQYPNSEWTKLASMQLVTIFSNQKNYEKALYYLLKYMDNKTNAGDLNSITDDKAWFYLGQILENSKEYRDVQKSMKAYYKVIENPDSMFYSLAKKRISALEKFYQITP